MKSSSCNRLCIIALKYAPVISAFLMRIHVILLLLGIDVFIVDYTFSLPIFPWLVCFIWSKAFGFCKVHRAFITYTMLVSYCIKIQDTFGFGNLLLLFRIIVAIIGFGLIVWFIIHQKKYNNKCYKAQ